MSGLRVDDLHVSAGETQILKSVRLDAPMAAITGLLGPNGAGKTTLLTAILGLRPIDSGSVMLGDRDLGALSIRDRARFCAYVEQSATTGERLTVRDVVALGRIPFQSTWQADLSPTDAEAADRAISRLGLLPMTERLYHTLSGGEQQRVQLARALAQQPRLLLLDEPTSHLDIEAQLSLLALLHANAAAGCTTIVTLHDINLAARFCDHLVLLKAGAVLAEGPPTTVLTPDLLLAAYGVRAIVLDAPGGHHPLVYFDQTRPPEHTESG